MAKISEPKLKFLSYGDEKFSESRCRIQMEASELNFFTDIKIHTEKLYYNFLI